MTAMPRRPPPAAPLVALALLLAPRPGVASADDHGAGAHPVDAADVAAGLRIYREGILPDGRPLRAVAQSGTIRSGADAACTACHRRSGYGTSEGPVTIPSITATALFGWSERPPERPLVPGAAGGLSPANATVAAQAALSAARLARIAAARGAQRRPPYDEASLARAIRAGVDVTGRPLAHGMPRYALGDEDLRVLLAYLRTLSTGPAPGVTAEEIHFATVIEPGVDPARRRAMLDVMEAFVRDKNAGTRKEDRRRSAGTEREYRAYRTWILHVWDLSGQPESWGRQLEERYRRQPVFALIGGLGPSGWGPVHRFSEQYGVPCLFPQVDLPAAAPGFYTLYLSRGLPLEAEALAAWLREHPPAGGVTQVFRQEEASAAAAAAFRTALPEGARPAERVVDGPPSREFWDRLAAERAGGAVVLWLPKSDLAEAGGLVGPASPVGAVYLSATLLGSARPATWDGGGPVRLLHPLDLPQARGSRLLRVKRWLHDRAIPLLDEKVQMNAYFAVAVTADAVGQTSDLFSREYLVERLEHMVGNTVTPSIYPRVSLGPDQRFASKGSYIVRPGGRGADDLEPVSGWVTP